MSDPVQEFQETLILQQGIVRNIVFDYHKITLHFWAPRHFDIHFYKVENYRTAFPLFGHARVLEWSASRESEYLRSVLGRRRREGLPPRADLSQLCHFHMKFADGHLDVLAEDYIFGMGSG